MMLATTMMARSETRVAVSAAVALLLLVLGAVAPAGG
jgi:hypothetical protein